MGDEPESVKGTIMGHQFSIKGMGMAVVVILAVALGGLGYLFWEQMQASNVMRTLEHQHIVDALTSIEHVNAGNGKLLEEQNFIILQDTKEKERIAKGLRMPQSLRNKLDN